MAYARVWDNAAPSGAAAANTIDTIFNQFREDTQQRISSILLAPTDIDDDPLTIDPARIGSTLARIRAFQPFQEFQGALGYVASDPTPTGNIKAGPISFVPAGASITRVIHYVRNMTISAATFELYSTELSTGTPTLVSTTALGGTTVYQAVDSGVFGVPFAVADTQQLQIRWTTPTSGTPFRYYGCRLFYTIPNFASIG